MFLDTRFIESVVIQTTGIHTKSSTLVEFYKIFDAFGEFTCNTNVCNMAK